MLRLLVPDFFEEEVVSKMEASEGSGATIRRHRLGSPRIYSLGER
jgi:hypothetical protein